MRNSSTGLIVGLLLVFILVFLALLLLPSVWARLMLYAIENQPESAGLPGASTPVSGFGLPTAGAPASIGAERTVGDVALSVTRVIRPADGVMGSGGFQALEDDEHYLAVLIAARCLSAGETCSLTDFDFGVRDGSGRTYSPRSAAGFSGLTDPFVGGEFSPGQTLTGTLVFVVKEQARGLVLSYPDFFAFGASAEFRLE